MKLIRSLWYWMTSIAHGLYATAAPPDGEIVVGHHHTVEYMIVEWTDKRTWKFLRIVRWGGSPIDLERCIRRTNPRAQVLGEGETLHAPDAWEDAA